MANAGTALVVEQDAREPDAIIMLASHEWERLPAAAALARQHPGAIVLLTIPTVITIHTCHRCGERLAWFEAKDVARERVRLLRVRVGNTYDEARAALDHASREPFGRLAIVTSPYHTRRARATFETVFRGTGIDIRSVAASPASGDPTRWWADPYDRYYVRYEWAAILKYRLQYGVPFTVSNVESP